MTRLTVAGRTDRATRRGAHVGGGLVGRRADRQVAAFVCPQDRLRQAHRGAPVRGGGPAAMEERTRLREVEVRQIGSDTMISGYTGEPF